MKQNVIYCKRCDQQTYFLHTRDIDIPVDDEGEPFMGIEVHVPGTERFVCTICNYAIFKEEGETLGLVFLYD